MIYSAMLLFLEPPALTHARIGTLRISVIFQGMNKIEKGNFSANIYVIWSYNTPKNMYFSPGIQ